MSAKRLTDEQVAEIENTMWSRWESMNRLGANELGDLMRAEMLDAGHAWAQVEALKAQVAHLTAQNESYRVDNKLLCEQMEALRVQLRAAKGGAA
jgi:hypothetical protein